MYFTLTLDFILNSKNLDIAQSLLWVLIQSLIIFGYGFLFYKFSADLESSHCMRMKINFKIIVEIITDRSQLLSL